MVQPQVNEYSIMSSALERLSTVAITAMAALSVSAVTVMVTALEEGVTAPLVGACPKGVMSRLYLGQATPNGIVDETQWRAFVAESVTPRFPAGFTELLAQGHWRDSRGTINQEQTRIVEIAHSNAPLVRESVRAIAADYRHRFAQESVLITELPTFQCLESAD
jgi:hypothetical protein